MKIKELPIIDRPREKLLKYGITKLSNEELLSLILRTGNNKHNAVSLSKSILKKYSNEDLLNISVGSLSKISGVGNAKACSIVASIELTKRLLNNNSNKIILSPKDVWQRMEDIRASKKEHFVVFYLDSRSNIIKREIVTIGILNQSLIHPREVFETAIKNNALNILICHNHPSNVTEPSEEDLEITKKLVQAGELLKIQVLDHVIVTKDSFYSFKSNHLL